MKPSQRYSKTVISGLRDQYQVVIDDVCQETKLASEDIFGTCRLASFVGARRLMAGRLRKLGLSTTEIGIIMDRDHTSIAHLLGLTRRGREIKEHGFKPRRHPRKGGEE